MSKFDDTKAAIPQPNLLLKTKWERTIKKQIGAKAKLARNEN